jgi:hypothetical protein
MGHLLSHEQNKLPVLFIGLAQETTKLTQETSILPRAAPCDIIRRPALWEIRHLGRLLAVIKKLVHGDFQGSGHFLQRFDGRNGVAVFNAGDVAAKQARALFDFALGESLRLT